MNIPAGSKKPKGATAPGRSVMLMEIEEKARDALDAGEKPIAIPTTASVIMVRKDIVTGCKY